MTLTTTPTIEGKRLRAWADAVVGVSIDYEAFSHGEMMLMLMLTATGTADSTD